MKANSLLSFGAGARNRTETGSPPVDFEDTFSPKYIIVKSGT